MDWKRHPKYRAAQDLVVTSLRSSLDNAGQFRPVIFLCGGRDSHRRNSINRYIEKHHPNLVVFYAEHVWEHIKGQKNRNALELESDLAKLADCLVVVVESAGTFAEIGAFAINIDLREKLLPIVDVSKSLDESFLMTGPIKWVNDDSRFKPTILSDFDTLLEAFEGLSDRFGRVFVGRRGREEQSDVRKHLLLLMDLIAVIGPASSSQCDYILREILGDKPAWDTETLLGLGTALRLLSSSTASGPTLYSRSIQDGKIESFRIKRTLDLGRLRARFLSWVMGVPGLEQYRALTR